MAQFECPLCGAGFEQRSAFDRHMRTSHPAQAPSAADLEHALAGIELPGDRDDLARHARENGHHSIAALLDKLPAGQYRDAAEVARAFGALRSHEDKPGHQPSVRGGRAALGSPSAARIASLFEGMDLPASRDDLLDHARARADEDELAMLRRLPERTYRDMADIAMGFGEARRQRDH